MEIFETLSESIVAVYDGLGNKIPFNNVEIKQTGICERGVPYKYPSLFLDGCYCSLKDKKVSYVCPNCNSLNTILLKRFLSKTSLECKHCKEKNETKIEKHKRFFITGEKDIKAEKVLRVFEAETEEFKRKYYNLHLTNDEFKSIVQNIVSINGADIKNNSDITYIEHENVNNQYGYVPNVSIDGVKTKFCNVYVECPNCGEVYRISDSRSKKSKLLGNLFCKRCVLNNETFSLEKFCFKDGTYVFYQGGLEKTFIEKCVSLGYKIKNGPIIEYFWHGRTRRYYVDFEFCDLPYIVEIKGDHVWHKEQVRTGKWEAKANAAIKYAEINKKNYVLLFENDINKFFKNIINYE